MIMVIVNLKKTSDRVPREVVQWVWVMRKLGVKEWLVQTIIVIYKGSRTSLYVIGEESKKFEVKVGVHQRSGICIEPPSVHISAGGNISQD